MAATFFGRLSDNYSTTRVISVSQDPRFREYGFNKYFFEGNLVLEIHPDAKYMLRPRNMITELLTLGLSYISPIAGARVATGSFFAYSNNRRIEEILNACYQIGDRVKEKIQSGYSHEQIIRHLKQLQTSDMVHVSR
jgi:hypothetical protein